jgi:hypothetical protein
VIRDLAPGESCILTQASLAGNIGQWQCIGKADNIRAERHANGVYVLAVLNVKASAHDHVEYRVQVAFYIRLLKAMLQSIGITIATVKSGIITMPDTNDSIPEISDPDHYFDFSPYDRLLDTLMVGADADATVIMSDTIESILYALGPKC